MNIQEKIVLSLQQRSFFRRKGYRFLAAINDNWLYEKIYQIQIRKVLRKYKDFPLSIALESSSLCNANCIMCPREQMTREKSIMPLNLAKKLIDEIAAHGKTTNLGFSGFGEPLLDNNLFQKIKYAKGKGISFTNQVINGSMLTKEKSEALIESGVDQIIVSIDSFKKETYEKIRVGSDFERVISNIRQLINLRGRRKKPSIMVVSLILRENKNDLITAHDVLGKGVVHQLFREPYDFHGCASRINIEHSIHSRKNNIPCQAPLTLMTVQSDGKVPLCCIDFDCEYVLGDASKQTIKEIWHGQPLRNALKLHLAGRREEIDVCRNCNYFPVWWGS